MDPKTRTIPGGHTDATSTEPTPEIESFTLGPYETNCYLVTIPGSQDCWIVDASFGPAPIIRRVRERRLRPQAIVLTHAHVDHIAGIPEVLREFNSPSLKLPVWLHGAEAEWLANPMLNLSAIDGMPVSTAGPDRLLKDKDELQLAGTTWHVLHTPGHSPGGITLYHPASGQALVGDALFASSVGRSDLPGADPDTLTRSIRKRLYALPDDTRILPGHGPPSTIGRERRTNPFVQG